MDRMTLIIGTRNFSSWSLRAWLAMKATGEEFDEVVVPLYRPETRNEILRHSPSGRVPVLRHGALMVWDSLAICEHLAESFPDARLWPADRAARATARSVAAEMHSGFVALRTNMPMDCRSSNPGAGRTPEVLADVDRIVAIWESCRRGFGSDGRFLFGAFTIADAFYAPVVSRFLTYEVCPESGIAQDYIETVQSHPWMEEWLGAARAER